MGGGTASVHVAELRPRAHSESRGHGIMYGAPVALSRYLSEAAGSAIQTAGFWV